LYRNGRQATVDVEGADPNCYVLGVDVRETMNPWNVSVGRIEAKVPEQIEMGLDRSFVLCIDVLDVLSIPGSNLRKMLLYQ